MANEVITGKEAHIFINFEDKSIDIALTDITVAGETSVETNSAHGLIVGDYVKLWDLDGGANPSVVGRVTVIIDTTNFTIDQEADDYSTSGFVAIATRVTNFVISEKGGTIDTTDSGSVIHREKVPFKKKDWAGTFDMFLRAKADNIPTNTQIDTLFHVESTDALIDRSGTITITDIGEPIPIEAEEVVKHSITFEGVGVLTKVNV